MTIVGRLAGLLLGLALVRPAVAEVRSVTASGFEIVSTATIAAPPNQVYAALGEIAHWWDPAHTVSKDASNLSLELRAGGCLCERLKDGGSVQHLQVAYAAPGAALRLRGALGPLQMEGVDGVLAWTLKAAEGGRTEAILSYVVGGYIRGGMESWAPRVDRVIDGALQRLKSFVEEKPTSR